MRDHTAGTKNGFPQTEGDTMKAKTKAEPTTIPSSPDTGDRKAVFVKGKGNPLLPRETRVTVYGATFETVPGPDVRPIDGKYPVTVARLNSAWPCIIRGSAIQVSPSGHVVISGTTSRATNTESAYHYSVFTPDFLQFHIHEAVRDGLKRAVKNADPETAAFLGGLLKNVEG